MIGCDANSCTCCGSTCQTYTIPDLESVPVNSIPSSSHSTYEISVLFNKAYPCVFVPVNELKYTISSPYVSTPQTFSPGQMQNFDTNIAVPYGSPVSVTVTGGGCTLSGQLSVSPKDATPGTYAPVPYPTYAPQSAITRFPTTWRTVLPTLEAASNSDGSKSSDTNTAAVAAGSVAAVLVVVAIVVIVYLRTYGRPTCQERRANPSLGSTSNPMSSHGDVAMVPA